MIGFFNFGRNMHIKNKVKVKTIVTMNSIYSMCISVTLA